MFDSNNNNNNLKLITKEKKIYNLHKIVFPQKETN